MLHLSRAVLYIVEPSNLKRKLEIGFKNRTRINVGREMGLKLHCSTEGRETTLGSSQRVAKKGQTNRRFERFGVPL